MENENEIYSNEIKEYKLKMVQNENKNKVIKEECILLKNSIENFNLKENELMKTNKDLYNVNNE